MLIANEAFDADERVIVPLTAASKTPATLGIGPRCFQGARHDRELFVKLRQFYINASSAAAAGPGSDSGESGSM
jgi:hypothetical protein